MPRPTPAYAGIDVAFAKRKRLPVSVCTLEAGRLTPLPLRDCAFPPPPAGRGNVAALKPDVVSAFAHEALDYLHAIERLAGVAIRGVALDAPRAPSQGGRRACERAMDRLGISCFATPDGPAFAAIRAKVRTHLDQGGAQSRLPHANQLWMLAGFALFETLGGAYACLEVFPQASVRSLGIHGKHKSKREGLRRQFGAVAERTGWSGGEVLHAAVKAGGYGALHDRLDAFMCAWVASLPERGRKGHGRQPDDVIWVPRRTWRRRGGLRNSFEAGFT